MPKRLEQQIRIPKGFGAVQVRADTFDEDARTVEVIWSTGVKVKRYSWDEGYYMEELSMDPKAIRMDRFAAGMSLLDSHDAWSMDSRLGTVVPGSVRVEGGKAYAVVKFSRKQNAEDILQDLRDGHAVQISVGYKIHKYEKSEGDDGELPTLRAIDWEPMELSAVPIPADAGAHSRSENAEAFDCVLIRQDASDAASAAPTMETPMNKREAAKKYTGEKLDALAIGAGISRAKDETDDALRARLLTKYDDEDRERTEAEAEAKRKAEEDAAAAKRAAEEEAKKRKNTGTNEGTTLSEEDAKRIASEAQAEERKRVADINALAERAGITDKAMIRKHIDDGSDVEAFRGAVFDTLVEREQRSPTFPHVETRGMQDAVDTRRAAIANALLNRYDSSRNALSDAGREWRAMSLLNIQKELMQMTGERTRGLSESEIAERAFHSTSDFPIILGDVVRTTLLAGYNAYGNTFQNIAKRNTVTNFKEIRRARLGENPELVKVNEHGEFPRGTMVEGSESYKIATYGRIIGMTRQMLINDDLNAFAQVPQQWGRQVAKLEGDIVWSMIVQNAKMSSDGKALFHADHGNLASAGAALGIAGLKAGRMTFRKQKDIDGNRIDLAPKFLYVPTDLEVDAQQLLQSTTTPTKTDDVVPEAIRSLSPVSEHRLDAISATCWFLFANPADVDGGLEYAYLAGNEEPYTESRMGFDVDGVEYKVRHDFGAGLTDWRFAYKNPGA